MAPCDFQFEYGPSKGEIQNVKNQRTIHTPQGTIFIKDNAYQSPTEVYAVVMVDEKLGIKLPFSGDNFIVDSDSLSQALIPDGQTIQIHNCDTGKPVMKVTKTS